MSSFRKTFALILGVFYLWVLVFPVSAVCTYYSAMSADDAAVCAVNDPVCCVAVETSACSAEIPDNSTCCGDEKTSTDCKCCTQLECFDCLTSLTFAIQSAAIDAPNKFSSHQIASLCLNQTLEILAYPLICSIDKPPSNSLFPVHIKTTVLRC